MITLSLEAAVAELVDAHDSKSCLARGVGSTPTSGITKTHQQYVGVFCVLSEYLRSSKIPVEAV